MWSMIWLMRNKSDDWTSIVKFSAGQYFGGEFGGERVPHVESVAHRKTGSRWLIPGSSGLHILRFKFQGGRNSESRMDGDWRF